MPGATNFPSLIPDSLFTCPRCGAIPPTASGVALNASAPDIISGALTGRCRRCEHTWKFTAGAPSTTTTGAANVQGAAVLTVAAGVAFSTVGAWLVIDSASIDGGAEIVRVSAAGGATTIPVAATPLKLTHAAGATVNTCTIRDLVPQSGNVAS
jgi:hypothetical protein